VLHRAMTRARAGSSATLGNQKCRVPDPDGLAANRFTCARMRLPVCSPAYIAQLHFPAAFPIAYLLYSSVTGGLSPILVSLLRLVVEFYGREEWRTMRYHDANRRSPTAR